MQARREPLETFSPVTVYNQWQREHFCALLFANDRGEEETACYGWSLVNPWILLTQVSEHSEFTCR